MTMKQFPLMVIAVLACLLLAMPHFAFAFGGTNTCGESGTSLASGATSPECTVQLPTKTDSAISCQTVVEATVIANHGSGATAQLIVGVSNPESGAYPMAPYVGMAHVITGYTPQITLSSGAVGSLSDMRIDGIIDDAAYGGTNVPGEPPFTLPASPPAIAFEIKNVTGGPINWAVWGGYVCSPIMCFNAGNCTNGLQ